MISEVEQFCMLTGKVQGWLWDWVCCGDEVKVSGTEEVKELCAQDLWTLSIPTLRSTRMVVVVGVGTKITTRSQNSQ